MFEITGKEISELNDSDLRSLVGLLCEAELRANKLPTAGVTQGGHQNAKDGGLDVRVELTDMLDVDGFIPRAATGFQVKKLDMPRSKIIEEMRPDGQLRPVISELADNEGAYIIVSSSGSTSDTALRDRRKAMSEAVSDIANATKLKLDFYDQERLAGWVRSHPPLILWVRGKLGKALQGWRPFENWANAPGGIAEEYLLDEEVRIHDGTNLRSNGMAAVEGINRLRTILLRSASSVRLAGLSGVGKTRLLQALFDERIGENALNSSQVFYADMSNGPNPDPRSFAEYLIALQKPAILAVDNCPPDLHRLLTSVCTASGSLVSLITVEYDVREDQPEETEVFRLEPASIALVEKMIQNRFDYVSQIDAFTIAEFSGGNARIAIALANTVSRGETLTDLKDEELFRRLFQQRNESNNTLLRSAEVCSLVYSFDCQVTSDELRLLGSLVGRSVDELFGDIAELKRRELVQRRNIWRAVLPQALANKLAQRALENTPLENILRVFVNGGSERLLQSFSRRLSYLHLCEAAVQIATLWLSENGLLSDVSNLNELGVILLENLAPLAPKATLEAIERAANRDGGQEFTTRRNKHFASFTRLLRLLAYDSTLFERSMDLMCRFALSEDSQENHASIRDLLKSLFFIHLSGTHASANQRLAIIEKLVQAESENEWELGLLLLSAALETWRFHSHYSFDFGAHPRDYGYWPQTKQEVHTWFSEFVSLSERLTLSDKPIADKVKILLAEKFRGLWIGAGIFDELERTAKSIAEKKTWNEGWIAVRHTIKADSKQMESELLGRLQKLEELLRPNDLLEKARVYALSGYGHVLDLADVEEGDDEKASSRYQQIAMVTRQIGKEVASDEETFRKLLPELVTVDGLRLDSFAWGLAEGCKDPLKIWKNFRDQLLTLDVSQRNHRALCGFLASIAEANHELSDQILNDAVADDVLGIGFLFLQTSVKIDEQGVERLKQSLVKGLAPIRTYKNLAYGRAHESISDDDLSDLLRIISLKPDGLAVAIDILGMRLHSDKENKREHSGAIKFVGKDLLAQVVFSREQDMDYDLSEIAEACLEDSDVAIAEIVCGNLAKALSDYKFYSTGYPRLLECLAQKQPRVFLESFLSEDEDSRYLMREVFTDNLSHRPNPLSLIADNVIIDWCENNPATRYPVASDYIIAYRQSGNEGQFEWTSLSFAMIDNAPDPVKVLNEFKKSFRPSSWSGSRADIMQKRLSLVSSLKSHKNPVVSEWASNEERVFEQEIKSEREWEEKRNRARDERFE